MEAGTADIDYKVRVTKVRPHAPEFQHESIGSLAAYGLFAVMDTPVVIGPLGSTKIPVGYKFDMPEGIFARVGMKTQLESAGKRTLYVGLQVIDCNFEDEVEVLVTNISTEPFPLLPLDPIALVIFQHYVSPPISVVIDKSVGDGLVESVAG